MTPAGGFARIRRVLADPHRIGAFASARLLRRANLLAAENRPEAAVRVLRLLLLIRRKDLEASLTLTQILTHLQRYEGALLACARSLELAPDSPLALASLENILPVAAKSKRFNAAIHALKRCVAAAPWHAPTQLALVDLLIESGRHEEAFDACRHLLDLGPQAISLRPLLSNVMSHPDAQPVAARLEVLPVPHLHDVYHRLVARNAVDALTRIIQRFHYSLGTDPNTVPLTQWLSRFAVTLAVDDPDTRELQGSALIRFEVAWHRHTSKTDDAITLFESVFRDTAARMQLSNDPFTKEAVVRSGEILARHHEKQCDINAAIAVYREILAMDGSALAARRLALLLTRQGNLREAARCAETAIVTKPNLFPHLRNNPYVASLEADMRAASQGSSRSPDAGRRQA